MKFLQGTLVTDRASRSRSARWRNALAFVVLSCSLLGAPLDALAQGTVVAWGENDRGECDVPPGLMKVAGVAGGANYSLALKSDGTVVGWGDHPIPLTIPVGLNDAVAISAGTSHALALRSDGTVTVWGDNSAGQLEVPAGLNGVTAIAAGATHSLALRQDGTVIAWGSNSGGEATVPVGLVGVTAIAAGWDHNLALLSDGTVVGWGTDDYGEATPPADLTDAKAVATSFMTSMALKSDGSLVFWGRPVSSYAPFEPPLTGVFTAIAIGPFHGVALRSDGTVAAWGDDRGGKVSGASGLSDITAVAAGRSHNIAIQRSIAPESAIDDLKAYISLQTTIKPAIRNALLVKLNAALNALASHDLTQACLSMQDFINLVNAQGGKRQISPLQAEYMTGQAADIKQLIGCP